MKKYLVNHKSEETALVINNFVVGKEVTKAKFWLETVPSKGDRLVMTYLESTTNEWTKEKKTTYFVVASMFIVETTVEEKVTSTVDVLGITHQSTEKEVLDYIAEISKSNHGKNPLTTEQKKNMVQIFIEFDLGFDLEKEPIKVSVNFINNEKGNKIAECLVTTNTASVPTKAIGIALNTKYVLERLEQLGKDNGVLRIKGIRGLPLGVYRKGDFDNFFEGLIRADTKEAVVIKSKEPILAIRKGDNVIFSTEEINQGKGKIIKYSSNKEITLQLSDNTTIIVEKTNILSLDNEENVIIAEA